jgi:hypothetical protein
MLTHEEAARRMEELAEQDSNDAEISGLQLLVDELIAGQPVYYQPDGWKWCHRHNGPLAEGGVRCMGWFWQTVGDGAEDPGRCGGSPLYVEALDP